MHAEISLSYGADTAIKKLDPARYRLLYENCPWMDLPHPQPQTEEEWTQSKWHVYSVFVRWPLVLAALFAMNRAKKANRAGEE